VEGQEDANGCLEVECDVTVEFPWHRSLITAVSAGDLDEPVEALVTTALVGEFGELDGEMFAKISEGDLPVAFFSWFFSCS